MPAIGFRLLCGVLLASSIVGCEDEPTAPEGSAPGAALETGGSGDPPPNSAVGVMGAQATSMEFYPWTDFGSPFVEPTYVEIEVSGMLAAHYGPSQVRFGADAGKLWQHLDARGWYNASMGSCGAGVKVGFTQSSGANFCIANNAEPVLSSRSIKAVVKGQPRMWRNKGPWLDGCNNTSSNPCFTLAGTQTITVRPTADKLQVVASASEVRAGEQVTFTASTTDGSPFTIREWIWVEKPAAPPVVSRGLRGRAQRGSSRTHAHSLNTSGAGSSCVSTSNVCTVTVNAPGAMFVRAWVVSRIEQAEARVTIAPPKLVVYCSGEPARSDNSQPIVRGQSVSGVAMPDPPSAFELTARRAQGSDGNVSSEEFVEELRPRFGIGDTAVWSGPAALSTTVTFEGRVLPAGTAVSGEASFSVVPRAWSKMTMPPAPLAVPANSAPPLKAPFPLEEVAGRDTQPINGALATNQLQWQVHMPWAISYGPNSNWWYVPGPPQVTGFEVFYSEWLDQGSAFHQAQRPQGAGEPVPARYPRYCVPSDVDNLRAAVIAHEGGLGSSSNSHYSAQATFLEATDAVSQWERLVLFQIVAEVTEESGQQLRAGARAHWNMIFEKGLQSANDEFDEGNRVPLPACKFRYP